MADISELQSRRETVKRAIDAVLVSGKSYQIGTRKVTREDIDKLEAMLDRIDQQIAAQQNVPPFFDNAYQVFFEGR